MAQSHTKYGHLEPLQPGDKIDEYHQRFLLYCTANNIVDADKMKAIFLTTVGGTTYSILSNLVSPAKPQDKTLDELITLLKNQYEPRKIVIAERFKFYKRQQKEGESIANYLAELRRLAKHCEFADSLNTALRDQLVCSLRHEGLQQKVLAERDLTLEKALSLTQAHETARHELKLLQGEPQPSRQTYQAAETTFTVQASGGRRFTPRDSRAEERVCHRCDGRNHDSEKCWYKSATCRVCNVRGHMAKACRKRKQSGQKYQASYGSEFQNRKQATKSTKSRHQTNQVEEDDEVSMIYTLTDKQSSPKVTVEVAGALVTMDVDTGASMTMIPAYIYKRFLTHVKLQKSRVKLQTYSGERLTVRGKASIRYGNQTAREKMVVVEVQNKPAVLGRNWLSQIRLDWHMLFRVDGPTSPRETLGTDYIKRYPNCLRRELEH
ncbi:uncharacterized protein LOC134179903 [Corticium candelabrum]|uniref:uncharacterized protein LOC134179903 n=1 Tax=Corticium candelabrum TaxID=121492 RepID=UPI002E25786D|nr:uncharacterized protein LOC134179903 [Corticium candelabrum]